MGMVNGPPAVVGIRKQRMLARWRRRSCALLGRDWWVVRKVEEGDVLCVWPVVVVDGMWPAG